MASYLMNTDRLQTTGCHHQNVFIEYHAFASGVQWVRARCNVFSSRYAVYETLS